MKINSNTKLKDVLKIKGIEKILEKHSFPCVSCPMAKMEMDILEIGYVCGLYGIDERKLLLELNSFNKPKPITTKKQTLKKITKK